MFRIHLPRIAGTDEPAPAAPSVVAKPSGSETVLVVEDQEEVRSFVVKALVSHGYRVLQAADGNQALILEERHSGAIDVLLTDVVLPGGMNGRELADRFRIGRPDIKVIYTSGYTQDLIAHRGVPDDISYIPKPYTADQIAAKVREAIGRAGAS